MAVIIGFSEKFSFDVPVGTVHSLYVGRLR